MSLPDEQKSPFHLLAALCGPAAALALYVPVIMLSANSGGFPFDSLAQYLGTSDLPPFFELAYRRVLYGITMGADYSLWGERAMGFHLTNILLHALCCFVLYELSRLLTGNRLLAAAASVVFALHPAAVEAVLFIPGRSGIMSLTATMASFILYMGYRRDRVPAAAMASGLFLLLALAAGQGALMLPLMAGAFELLNRRDDVRWGAPLSARNAAFLAGAWLVGLACYALAFYGPGEFTPAGGMDTSRMSETLTFMGFYLREIFFTQAAPLMPRTGDSALLLLFALLPVAGVVILATEGRRTAASVLLLVVLALIPAGLNVMTASSGAAGMRFVYPAVGFTVVFLCVLAHSLPRPALRWSLVGIVAVLWIALLPGQVRPWMSAESVLRVLSAARPALAAPRVLLASSIYELGDRERGTDVLLDALNMKDTSFEDFNSAVLLMAGQGELPFEEGAFHTMLTETQGVVRANYALGLLWYRTYLRGGDGTALGHAVDFLERAVQGDPQLIAARFQLGMSYYTAGVWDRARQEYQAVIAAGSAAQTHVKDAEHFLRLTEQRLAEESPLQRAISNGIIVF